MISLGKFWRWWRGELAAMTPEPLKIAFFGGSSATPARFVSGQTDVKKRRGAFELPDTLLAATPPVVPKMRRARRIDVTLPEHLVLKRQIQAPRKARGKLEALARLDLKRNTPIPEEAAHWVLGPDKVMGQNVTVTQYVTKKSDLAGLRRTLTDIGLTVRKFVIAAPDGTRLFVDEGAQNASVGRGWRRMNALLALGALSVGAFLWLQPALVAHGALPALEDRLQALRSEAVSERRQLDAATAERAEADRLNAAMLRRPRLVESLRDVTVSLPDAAWVSSMTFTPETMTLSGETSDAAADLVLDLSENRQFGNPRLSGPTTRSNTGREKFEIATRPGGAP